MLRTCKIAVSEHKSEKGNCNGITPKPLAKSVASNFWSAPYGYLGTTAHSIIDASGLKKLSFYVLLTVHLSIILDNDELDAHLLYFTISLL